MKKLAAMLLVLMAVSVNSYAYDDEMDMEDPIDVSGNFQGKSPADAMKVMRDKFEQRTELMVRKKIERARFKQEMELFRQMSKKMKGLTSSIQDI